MKNLTYILFIFLASCSSKQNVDSKFELSDKDVANIIEQGYGGYLDSIGRKKEIYNKFAVLEDSSEMKNMIYELEEKYNNGTVLLGISFFGNPPKFESTIIPNSRLNSFKILNNKDVNLIWKKFKEKQPNFKTSHAISKPFRPDSSDIVVIQEFKYPPITIKCMPRRRQVLFFKKTTNKWKLLKVC